METLKINPVLSTEIIEYLKCFFKKSLNKKPPSRLDTAEEKVNELEGRAIEITKNEARRENRLGKM